MISLQVDHKGLPERVVQEPACRFHGVHGNGKIESKRRGMSVTTANCHCIVTFFGVAGTLSGIGLSIVCPVIEDPLIGDVLIIALSK